MGRQGEGGETRVHPHAQVVIGGEKKLYGDAFESGKFYCDNYESALGKGLGDTTLEAREGILFFYVCAKTARQGRSLRSLHPERQ